MRKDRFLTGLPWYVRVRICLFRKWSKYVGGGSSRTSQRFQFMKPQWSWRKFWNRSDVMISDILQYSTAHFHRQPDHQPTALKWSYWPVYSVASLHAFITLSAQPFRRFLCGGSFSTSWVAVRHIPHCSSLGTNPWVIPGKVISCWTRGLARRNSGRRSGECSMWIDSISSKLSPNKIDQHFFCPQSFETKTAH